MSPKAPVSTRSPAECNVQVQPMLACIITFLAMDVQLGAPSAHHLQPSSAAKLKSMDFCYSGILDWQEGPAGSSRQAFFPSGTGEKNIKSLAAGPPSPPGTAPLQLQMEPQGVQPSLTTLVPELFGPGGVVPFGLSFSLSTLSTTWSWFSLA